MQRNKTTLLLSFVAVIALFVANLSPLWAQSAQDIIDAMQNDDGSSLYGSNPYESDEEEPPMGKGEKPDSLEKRMRLPLESYFFSDSVRARENFVWNIDKEFNRVKVGSIDTTLNDFRIDNPVYKKGVGDMTLGGLGQAAQPISFYDRNKYYDFVFAQPYDAYIYTMESAPFYNVKRPFTLMSYLESGQKTYRETNFGILHAQNVSPSTGFAIDYKSRGTKGLYQRQDTKNHNLALTFSHTGKRYSVHAGYLNNSIDTEESGGVVGLWAIRDSLFEMPIGVPMKLGDAEATNKYRNNSIFIEQSYGVPLTALDEYDFTMADHTAFYVGHTFEYNTWSRVYSDVRASYVADMYGEGEEEYYYDDWFINADQTRDSIRERVISNRIYIQAQPWDRDAIVGTLDGGIGFDINKYSQFGLDAYLTGEYDELTRTSWFVYGSATGKLRRYFEWRGDVKLYPSGYRAGDMTVGGDVRLSAYIRNKPITLSGTFKLERRSASYWQESLFSNHYIFNNNFNQENDTRFNVKLEIPSLHFELSASESMVDNMIYYNEDCEVTQNSGVVSLTEIYLRKKFKIGKGLNLDHRILAQWTTDDEVAPVPDFSAYLSYYYEMWVVKNVLRVQLGVDGRYTSSYYMPDYNPALSTFYNQHSEKIGGYPYLDAYVAAKWKRMRILIKYQHLNNGMFGNDEYFSVANYPLNPGMFKLGISWGFYD